MGILLLEATGARLSTSFGKIEGVPVKADWILGINVQLAPTERLKLATGEKLTDVDMKVTFRAVNAEHLKWAAQRSGRQIEEICGAAFYFEGREARDDLDASDPSIIMETFVSDEAMDSLIALARHGRYPRTLSVHIDGMNYDYPPDGITWDNKAATTLPITSVYLDLPLEVVTEEPLPGEPKTPVGADLEPVLRELVKWQKWTFWLIVAAATVAVFR